MLHPLASLWRHQARVSFYTSGSLDRHAPSTGGAFAQSHATPSRRRFSSADDAFNYLRQWQGEPASRAELKRLLQCCGPSLVSSYAGIDGWLHALAARLTAGAIEVLEEHGRCTMPGRLVAAASAGASAVDIAALPSLTALVVESPVAPDVASDLAPEQPAPLPDAPAESVESAESSTSPAVPEAPAESPAAPAVDAPQAATQAAPADALEPAPVPVTAPMLLSDAPAESASSEAAPETPAQNPDTPAPEWPEAVDQQAQAQALEQAADSGAPFCEICAKQQPAAAAPVPPLAPPAPRAEATAPDEPRDAVAEWPQADQLAQAQALEQAAESGVPFCEICARQQQDQKQKQEQAPGPAPLADAPAKPDAPQETPDAPAPEWPQAADQVAQAQALEQAAESGVPFCEICARQQLTRKETNDG